MVFCETKRFKQSTIYFVEQANITSSKSVSKCIMCLSSYIFKKYINNNKTPARR